MYNQHVLPACITSISQYQTPFCTQHLITFWSRSTFMHHYLHQNFSIIFLHAILGTDFEITLRMIHSNFNRIRVFWLISFHFFHSHIFLFWLQNPIVSHLADEMDKLNFISITHVNLRPCAKPLTFRVFLLHADGRISGQNEKWEMLKRRVESQKQLSL